MQTLRLKGKFRIDHFRDETLLDTYEFPNGIVDVGLNYILDVMFNSGTQLTSWFMGLISNGSFTGLANGDTMSSHGGWFEFSDYDGQRPSWDPDNAAGRAISNPTTVDFDIEDTGTIRGMFITSNNSKGGSTGILWSTAAFGTTIPVQNGDVLKVTYTLNG